MENNNTRSKKGTISAGVVFVILALAQALIAMKAHAQTNSSFQSLVNDHQLTIYVDDANGLRDRAIVAFNVLATDTFDPIYDANKLGGDPDRLSIYSYNNSLVLSRNTLIAINSTPSIEMGFAPGLGGQFTMSFDELNTFDPTNFIILEDKKMHILHDTRTGNYSFTGMTNDARSRFTLHFTPAMTTSTTDATCSTTGIINVTQPGSVSWSYTISSDSTSILSTGTLNDSTPIALYASTGVYTITLTDSNNYTVVKQVQVGGVQPVESSFTFSDTTIEEGGDITFTSTATNAINNNWDFGGNDTITGLAFIRNFPTPGTFTVTLTADNNACIAVSSQQITVTAKEVIETSISLVNDKSSVGIWICNNTVYIDMSNEAKVDAEIEIYNVAGQQLSAENFEQTSVYTKTLTTLNAASIIVRVKNNGVTTTKKLFAGNSK